MKNRAKCKLCNDILESFHAYDYVTCKCGEISISGGNDRFECSAKDWKNFMRVDEDGNEIMVKVVDEAQEPEPDEFPKMNREQKIQMLEAMVRTLENLPNSAMDCYITHYDLYSFMLVVVEILKSDSN